MKNGSLIDIAQMSSDKEIWRLGWKIGRKVQNEQWSGRLDQAPNLQQLSALTAGESLSDEQLVYLTSEIVRNAPVQAMPALLSILMCSFCRAPQPSEADPNATIIDMRVLQSMSLESKSSRQPVCGVVFKKGDLVWTCRQCAKDVTCVLCDECFRQSDHEGHEV